ncbi:MAG TPA: nucleoside triphosphate pyrophosphatase [Thermoleophilaceae bacterium]
MADALILASRSPQRRAILEQLGVTFTIEVPDVEELAQGEPAAVALENARRKAAAVVEGGAPPQQDRSPAAGGSVRCVLAVDTVVALDGQLYGKPRDAGEAAEFLRALSGREHEVMSAIVLCRGSDERSEVPVTRVRFRTLEPADVDWYVQTGEWRERAGGYAIQGRGATLVEAIEGDYGNVVGLPVEALVRLAPGLFR